ncbi:MULTISPECIES: NAD-dependent epimerase/dehydratase family protein [Enterococcus]|uniref:NAD-dependent epimerase/dehydratase family protein n=1 Tax=Enterococcus TaxID=1350 RepID=UPI0010FFA805|nr:MULTISPECIES: NAD-dependent epimerase/dehydratase family protein [Enterococcus]QCT93193.1 sugar nucleotide-binding protein [Enterococcus sp. M190262]
MKRILITGENSYIGTSFVEWTEQHKYEYSFETISVRDTYWKKKDFSNYDCIVHLAAIVHVREKNQELYYKINRDLAVEVAEKACHEKVKQFIFFSTMSVFGVDEGAIGINTEKNPRTAYGKSKLEAEIALQNLENDEFKVAIIRPPMIYGAGCTGNYQKLSSLVKKILFFPKIDNKRSMLYIENLHSFLKIIIDNELEGIYHPQNKQFVNTSELVREIARVHNRKITLIPGFQNVIKFFSLKSRLIQKVFGSLYYDSTMLGYPDSSYRDINFSYQEKDFVCSIEESEK